MYDRDVDVPRLVAELPAFGSTKTFRRSSPRRPAAPPTRPATPFNSVGLNFYRDGQDSVAPHNDHLYEIVAGYPIALISLGATRLMTIRSKTPLKPGGESSTSTWKTEAC